jgi:uncharacterized integral membrane protein (TIGR02327 family)
MLEIAVHLIAFAVSLYALDALNFNAILRKNKVAQAQILFVLVAMGLAALVAQFLLGLRWSP